MYSSLRKLLTKLGIIEPPEMTVAYRNTQPNIEKLKLGELVIVIDSNKIAKWAVFKCPCKCGLTYRLQLSKYEKCHWTCTLDWLGRPTITPSIHQRNACKAHFWITSGYVEWCTNRFNRNIEANI